jgi:ankyrin repeat protein
MPSVLTKEQSKELLALCRTSRLYEVEDWIRAGKLLRIADGVRGTPLQIAVQKGFRSLIELLARNENQVKVKNKALDWAVEHRRMDLVELLVENGAEIASVPFVEVLRTWDPKIIRFFLDYGADLIGGQPFAYALADEVRTCLRIFKECQERHPEVTGQLKQQAESALRYFSHIGNLKWVNLMLGLGADPRIKSPMVYSRYDDDPECNGTAIEEACLSGKIEILRAFKVSREMDDLAELLRCAALSAHVDVIRYLLDLGALRSDRENRGSSALDRCLRHLEYEDRDHIRFGRQISRSRVSQTMEAITVLVKAGAVWRPNDNWSIRHFGRNLLKADPELVIDVFGLLKEHGACGQDTIHKFLDTPSMRHHLAGKEWHLRRLGLKCSETRLAPPVSNHSASRVSIHPPLRITHRLLARFNREKLYQEVWLQPMAKLARDYGVSDVALAKTCRKLMIPVPGRGYWAKVAAGKRIKSRPPLPPLPTADGRSLTGA